MKYSLPLIVVLLVFCACSTTKHIPDDDQLFIGLKPIEYTHVDDKTNSDHFITTQEEVEAALATAPNGALLGSSYYRSPLQIGLWIWNYADGSSGKFKQWLNRSFGSQPVLMSKVNPRLRASVARAVLRNNGYMHANVSYEEVTQKNPKKVKVAYTVSTDSLFLIDSMRYVNFPRDMQELIDSTIDDAYIRKGLPFAVSSLDAERTRLSQLFRNNGYYFYSPGYASYLADTFDLPYRAQLRLQMADSLSADITRKWHIGKVNVSLRRNMREELSDSINRRFVNVYFNGAKPPLKPRIILSDMKLRPRQVYSYDNYVESVQKLNSAGVFSSTDFMFTPRSGTDTLDLQLNCTLDKPYDFYFETNFNNRTIGRMGPEVKIGFVKRNAFRGGEKVDINFHGSYEWQMGGSGSSTNTYQYGADGSIEFPRIIAPFINRDRVRRQKDGKIKRPKRFYSTPWTIAKASTDVIQRPNYYKMHIVSGEWTYRWQNTEYSKHEFSPLTLKYQFKNNTSDDFDEMLNRNPYLAVTMGDYFIPKMRYTYTYTNSGQTLHPLRWETTVEESGNMTALFDVVVQGNSWSQKGKTLFKNNYSQFLRIETDLTKTWQIDNKTQLVGHVNAGYLWHYGNSDDYPFSESFFVGGANSIRAFTARSIGPGALIFNNLGSMSYVLQNGNMKFVANLEYRRRLFGSLYGAFFIDAGNVWSSINYEIPVEEGSTPQMEQGISIWNTETKKANFKASRFFSDLATGTGLGLRYDLEFLIIRIDWGLGLHVPYETEKSGYFNIPRFKDMHSLHFAIGYPF
jgi:outer membrane protein assembly factor BamA